MAVTAATTHGVLAYEVDATAATSGVVYLTGSFLRDLVVAANSGATIDAAFEDALGRRGSTSSARSEHEAERQPDHDSGTSGTLAPRCQTISFPTGAGSSIAAATSRHRRYAGRRAELRAEAAERRGKAEAKKMAKKAAGAKQSAGHE